MSSALWSILKFCNHWTTQIIVLTASQPLVDTVMVDEQEMLPQEVRRFSINFFATCMDGNNEMYNCHRGNKSRVSSLVSQSNLQNRLMGDHIMWKPHHLYTNVQVKHPGFLEQQIRAQLFKGWTEQSSAQILSKPIELSIQESTYNPWFEQLGPAFQTQ